MGGCAFPKISRCRKWLPPPDQERAKGIKHAAPCTQGAVIRAESADTQEPVLALGTPASSAMTALPLQKQNQVHGEKKKASSKLRPGPGSQVESQAGKCSLQALGWAVEKQLRIGGCRVKTGFPGGSAGKESACNAGDLGSIPGLGRSPGEGKGYPLQD